MSNILLGVTGSIAVYKAADLANLMTKEGYHVEVIMTKSAEEFVTPMTFRTLTKNRVYNNMFQEYEPDKVEHISIAKKTDICVIAPATANIIGKIAGGIADDMLTTVVMALRDVPIVICPAMNTNMYENPIVQRNINTLKELGYIFVDPKASYLACGDLGKGALADVPVIYENIRRVLEEKEEK